MKTYRKPSGAIIVLDDATPVNPALVEIASRPSAAHTIADAWATDPMNAAVCWRLKTAPEQDAEKNAELDAFLASAGGKVVKAIVLTGVDKGHWTLAELRAKYRSL